MRQRDKSLTDIPAKKLSSTGTKLLWLKNNTETRAWNCKSFFTSYDCANFPHCLCKICFVFFSCVRYNQALVPYLHRSVHQPWGRIRSSRSTVGFLPLGCTVARRGRFLTKKMVYIEVGWNILYYCSTQQCVGWNRGGLCGSVWETENYLLYLAFAHFLFPGWSLTWSYCISYFWPTAWRTSTLMSWKPNKRNKMWPCTHYNMKTPENE